jgi:hypothetical protein
MCNILCRKTYLKNCIKTLYRKIPSKKLVKESESKNKNFNVKNKKTTQNPGHT